MLKPSAIRLARCVFNLPDDDAFAQVEQGYRVATVAASGRPRAGSATIESAAVRGYALASSRDNPGTRHEAFQCRERPPIRPYANHSRAARQRADLQELADRSGVPHDPKQSRSRS